jgi:hypothetical protein
VCEPVHISLAFRCLQLLLKNVGIPVGYYCARAPIEPLRPPRQSDTNGAVDPTTSRVVSAGWLSPASHSTMRGRNWSAISASSAADLVLERRLQALPSATPSRSRWCETRAVSRRGSARPLRIEVYDEIVPFDQSDHRVAVDANRLSSLFRPSLSIIVVPTMCEHHSSPTAARSIRRDR